jgi:GT2 family glycosyltransferase
MANPAPHGVSIPAVLEPAVTVVVPTHNRPRRLQRLLAALRAQDLSSDAFEVVVVDDGSGPATARVLGEEVARNALRLRTVRTRIANGPAAARNAGWPLARAPLIAFTDDDCVPVRGWLTAALETHARSPDSIIQGVTKPDPAEQQKISPFSHTVVQTKLGPNFETCNIFYPRAVLESLGGFDESFGRRSAGEDTELAWRALESGCLALLAPGAVVFHAIERLGALRTLRLALRWTPCVRVLAEHPQTRVMLQRRIFWNVWHYLLWRSVLALFAPRWLRRVALTRYALQLRGRGRRLSAGAWSVPFFVLHDVIETWAVLRGAVRYRTLVL